MIKNKLTDLQMYSWNYVYDYDMIMMMMIWWRWWSLLYDEDDEDDGDDDDMMKTVSLCVSLQMMLCM